MPKTKNIHLGVDENFHRELKMMCAYRGIAMKDYALQALKERLQLDQKAIATEKKQAP